MTIVWLRSAVRTRYEQLDYIARDDPAAAIRLDEETDRQIALLCDHPKMGRMGRVAQTRELVLSRTPFILVYRLKKSRIEVLRVLHGAQSWPPEPQDHA